MTSNSHWPEEAHHLCAEIHAEDGIDPRYLARHQKHRKSDKKAHQLSKQVERTLSAVLPTRFEHLMVVSVEPLPNSFHLLVWISVTPSTKDEEAKSILQNLKKEKSWLRSEIARSIHRRRVPDLSFRLIIHASPD